MHHRDAHGLCDTLLDCLVQSLSHFAAAKTRAVMLLRQGSDGWRVGEGNLGAFVPGLAREGGSPACATAPRYFSPQPASGPSACLSCTASKCASQGKALSWPCPSLATGQGRCSSSPVSRHRRPPGPRVGGLAAQLGYPVRPGVPQAGLLGQHPASPPARRRPAPHLASPHHSSNASWLPGRAGRIGCV